MCAHLLQLCELSVVLLLEQIGRQARLLQRCGCLRHLRRVHQPLHINSLSKHPDD